MSAEEREDTKRELIHESIKNFNAGYKTGKAEGIELAREMVTKFAEHIKHFYVVEEVNEFGTEDVNIERVADDWLSDQDELKEE